jgi:hypothetical protein
VGPKVARDNRANYGSKRRSDEALSGYL